MNDIDRQRISTVKKLHELRLAWHGGAWQRPNDWDLLYESDAMHALLVRRADHLEDCGEGAPERAELDAIVEALAAYEEKRWPLGKVPGGKG